MEKETIYWLEQAVLDFTENVWVNSLMATALEKQGDQNTTYSYLDYYVVISPPASGKVIVSLELHTPSDPAIAILAYFTEYPTMPPQVCHWELQSAIDLIEYICEFWKDGLFAQVA